MLNLSLSHCADPELLLFVERGQNDHKGVPVICSRAFRRGSRQAVCSQENAQSLMWPLGQASSGHASALHDDSL